MGCNLTVEFFVAISRNDACVGFDSVVMQEVFYVKGVSRTGGLRTTNRVEAAIAPGEHVTNFPVALPTQ